MSINQNKMNRFTCSACIALMIAQTSFSQNVGIGTLAPTRARLEVNGKIGNTVAIFEDGHGVSLISSWPEVGFNAYYNNGPRYLSNGFARHSAIGSNFWIHGN
jgi:hypothetical protein